MARDGITFEQVAAAADALVGQGKQPTIKAVREELGTGSPNTVHRHLTAWREARPQAVATASTLPVSLTAAIAAEIERAMDAIRPGNLTVAYDGRGDAQAHRARADPVPMNCSPCLDWRSSLQTSRKRW